MVSITSRLSDGTVYSGGEAEQPNRMQIVTRVRGYYVLSFGTDTGSGVLLTLTLRGGLLAANAGTPVDSSAARIAFIRKAP